MSTAASQAPTLDWWRDNAKALRLKWAGPELKGPCPVCGGQDRFWIPTRGVHAGIFGCRGCQPGQNVGAFRAIVDVCRGLGWQPNGRAPQINPLGAISAPRGITPPNPAEIAAGRETGGPAGKDGRSAPERRWTHRTVAGERFQVVRTGDGKDKRIHREPSGVSGPYLPLGEPCDGVTIVEGETCYDAVRRAGRPAMTWAGGSNNWDKTDWTGMVDFEVVLWADKDEQGWAAMHGLSQQLTNQGCTITIVIPPDDAPDGWDAADTTADNVLGLIGKAVPLSAEEPEPVPAEKTWAIEASAYTREYLDALPPLPPAPLPFLPTGHVSMLHGDPKTGKSTLALLFACAVASGEELPQGLTPRPQGGRVLFVSCEETRNEIGARLLAMEAAHPILSNGITLANLRVASRDDLEFPPLTPDTIEPGFMEIERLATEHRPSLVVLDPLANLTSDESNEMLYELADRLDKLAGALDCATLLVHHNRKAQPGSHESSAARARGGSRLWAKVRVVLSVEKARGEPAHIWVESGNMISSDWESYWAFEAYSVAAGWPKIAAPVPYRPDDVLGEHDPVVLQQAVQRFLGEPLEKRRAAHNAGDGYWILALARALDIYIGTKAQRRKDSLLRQAFHKAKETGTALLDAEWVKRDEQKIKPEDRTPRPVIVAGEQLPEAPQQLHKTEPDK